MLSKKVAMKNSVFTFPFFKFKYKYNTKNCSNEIMSVVRPGIKSRFPKNFIAIDTGKINDGPSVMPGSKKE